MKRIVCLAALTLLISFNAFSPSIAHADTYEFLALGSDPVNYIYSMGNAGNVVVVRSSSSDICGTPSNLHPDFCYNTFVNGVEETSSITPPTILPEPEGPSGPGCFALPTGVSIVFSSCNNGHEIYATQNGTDRSILGIFNGPDLLTDRFSTADILSDAAIDSYGDIAFDDTFTEELYEAVDVSTHSAVPEPNSLALIGTGILGLTGVIRRKRWSAK